MVTSKQDGEALMPIANGDWQSSFAGALRTHRTFYTPISGEKGLGGFNAGLYRNENDSMVFPKRKTAGHTHRVITGWMVPLSFTA
jgi:hypothetical protein